MRSLYPPPLSSSPDSEDFEPIEVVPTELRPRPGDRPWIATNMIASADGGTAIQGVSGGLGSPSDKAVFRGLRSAADVILAGAETVRRERYKAPTVNNESHPARAQRGQLPHPRLAVVSGSLNLDLDLPLFQTTGAQPLPILFTSQKSARISGDRFDGLAEVIPLGAKRVDVVAMIQTLHQLRANIVLSEGGPTINGQLVQHDLVDEWNLAISPTLLGSDSSRAAVGPLEAGPPLGMTLDRVWLGDDTLFCRWTRKGQQLSN